MEFFSILIIKPEATKFHPQIQDDIYEAEMNIIEVF